MKQINTLMAFGFLGAMLVAVPTEGSAATESTTVTVISNSSSGIADANLTATLGDGTILGFRRSGSTVYLCGAISQKNELSIPDSIFYSSTFYAVNYVGYNRCDFDNAQSVTSLILPPTMGYVNYLPSTVKVLHLNNYMSSVNSSSLSNLTRILVPKSDLDSYFGDTDWSNYVLINEEGKEPSQITINMTKAGEFAQLLLQQVDNWYKVNELKVVGELNTDDLNVFKRMRQLTKLDLSKANISDIPNQFDGASGTGSSRNGYNLLEELILPDVNNIGEYAFAQCYRLKKITMPKVNSIGYGAFSRCGASQITLPEGISSIGSYAFYSSSLESIVIPSSINEISEYCFEYCRGLKKVLIPSSVTKIGYSSFRETGLEFVKLPGVETIGSYAFYDCKQLSEVIFAESLRSFESSPFYGCTALTEIDLPSSLTSMDYAAFSNCSNIKKVVSRAVTPPTHNNNGSILYGCDLTDVKLFVPAMSIDKYRVESGWKSFYTILPLDEKISNAYIYDDVTIDDATQFANDCGFIIGWRYQNRNGSSQYYCGAVDFNDNTTLSMHEFQQYHYLGYSTYNDEYSYDAHFTSLIPNGKMRSDKVQTTLRTYSTDIWYFISLPYDVKVSDIVYSEGAQFAIRKYSGLNRAYQTGNTWVNLTADSIMRSYEGYILKCNKRNVDFTFPAINNANKNKVFEKESITMPLGEYLSEFEHNRSWNLIGNPYPCYYDTRFLDFTAPITVWNRYYARYDAYSPIDDSYILHPAQSFFVQRPVDQASIFFDKSGRQKNANVRQLQAPSRSKDFKNANREIYNVVLSDGMTEDHTRFVINGDASCHYELDKDASKFVTDDNAAILLYTLENGVKYAINERPLGNGVINLGFYAPNAREYTISLNTIQGKNLILVDNETNTKTDTNGEYRFYTGAGFNDTRFSLIFNDETGINYIRDNSPQINVANGVVTADTSYDIYTIDGQMVGNYAAGATTILPNGVYVIKSKEVKRIIAVK